jgi:hypothetical protein
MATIESGVSSMVLTDNQSHATLAAALAAFQAELPKLTKDEKAKVKGETRDGRAYDRSYGYADLAQVVETVLPVLGKHGLSVTAKNTFTSDGYMLKVTLLHESGESDTGDWPLPDPRRSGPQDIGSAMTYGRRYLTLALSGAYPGGEDDDGAKAQTTARESWDTALPARPTTSQAQDQHRRGVNHTDEPAPAAPPKPIKTTWTDLEVYDYQAKMGTVTLDSAIKAYDWMAGKDLHKRYVANPTDANAPIMCATDVLAVKLAHEAQDASLGDIEGLRALATDRGLLKVQVSPTATLEQALYEARELAAHALTEGAEAPPADPYGPAE